MSIDRVIDFVANESEQTKVQSPFNREEQINYIPSTKFKLEVDKERVIREGIVPASEKDNIVPEMSWEINRNYLMKDGLCILDLLATNNWERPLHFAVTVGSDKYFNLDKYFRVEGLAYHLAPVRAESTDDQQPGEVNTDVMYD
ncbi:MAG: DUF2723 domain-containing protein, partial [Bacteroidota bacterium]